MAIEPAKPLNDAQMSGSFFISHDNKNSVLQIIFDMCIIKYFLDIISSDSDMLSKMQALFAEYPEVDLCALGFPSGNWLAEPLWSTR